MKNQKESCKTIYVTYGAVVLGVLIGSLLYLINLAFGDAEYFQYGLEEYSVGVVLNLPVHQLMIYILRQRLGQIFLFILGIIITSYGIVSSVYGLIFGTFYGIVMSGLFIQYGYKGIGYGIVCFFPHYLFYILAIYLCGKWFFEKKEMKNNYYGNVNLLRYIINFFVIFLLIFISLIWEIKFQKNILNYFYQYLV